MTMTTMTTAVVPKVKRKKGAAGSHGAMDKPRADKDFYRSPTHAMGLLLESIEGRLAPDDALVLDAAAGDGRLTKPLIQAGYIVKGIELMHPKADPALPITFGVDFFDLTAESAGNPTVIVTNPPYSISNRFIRHALAILPSGGRLHALMRHSWMTGVRRRDLLPSLHQITICRRLNMLPFDREHDDQGHDTYADFSWFSFTKARTTGGTALVHPPSLVRSKAKRKGKSE